MICCVDLEHPTPGPSLLSERPEAAVRKAELLTWKVRFEQLTGVPCLLQFHPERYTDAHPDGRAILANFFRLAGLARPTPVAAVHA